MSNLNTSTTSNVDALYYRDHKFLSNFAKRSDVASASVIRCTVDGFLDLAASHHNTEFYLLDAGGGVVTRVGEGKWFSFLTRYERVGQALARIGIARATAVRFALSIERSQSRLEFFKLPKGFDNAAQVADEAAKRDSEALRQDDLLKA